MARAPHHNPFPCAVPPGATRPGNASFSSPLGEGIAGLILCFRSVRGRQPFAALAFSQLRAATCAQPLGVQKTVPIWNRFDGGRVGHRSAPLGVRHTHMMNRATAPGHALAADNSDSDGMERRTGRLSPRSGLRPTALGARNAR